MGNPYEHNQPGGGGWNYSQPPSQPPPPPSRAKRGIIIFSVFAVLLVGLGIGGWVYTAQHEDEGFRTREPNTAAEQADFLDYAMEKEELSVFLARPLNERLSFGQGKYNRTSEMYYNTINTAVTKDNATNRRGLRVLDGGVPKMSRTSSAQEIMDFDSVANAVRTASDFGPKIASLYIDDSNTSGLANMTKYETNNPDDVSINTSQVLSDSGYYEEGGSVYIDITYSNPLHGSQPKTDRYKQAIFTSVLDGKEYVTYRALART